MVSQSTGASYPYLVAPPDTLRWGSTRDSWGLSPSCGGAACSGWKYKTDLLLKSIACHAGLELRHPGRWQLVDTAPRAHGSGDTARTAQPASQHWCPLPAGLTFPESTFSLHSQPRQLSRAGATFQGTSLATSPGNCDPHEVLVPVWMQINLNRQFTTDVKYQ